ncbi:MAG: ABC transporter ATP-binding protein [Ignavibacteria bacterium]
MEKIIEIKGLKKSFGAIDAVNSLSFDIYRNEIFGLVGPDGAGKTTTIRLLCGLLSPDEGEAKILGFDLRKNINKIKKEIGYLSQRFSLYSDLTVDENIEFFADIHGVRKYHDKRNELLSFMRLTEFRNFKAGKLSGGMKQKLALACTLIHTPKIIILDEPTTGVDPVSRRDFWRILSNLLKDGITILISTPYLDEAERFSRIALLNLGNMLRCDTPANIKESMKKQIIEIVTPRIRDTYNLLKNKTNLEVQLFGDRIDIAVNNSGSDTETVEKILSDNSINVIDKRTKSVSLENVFINLIQHQ